jgi:hypothetical protein
VIKNEAKKILIIRRPSRESQRTWNVETKVTPVVTEATGTISKSLRQYMNNLLGNHIKELFKKPPYWALHRYFGKH